MWPDTSALLHGVYATSCHVDLKSFVLLIVIDVCVCVFVHRQWESVSYPLCLHHPHGTAGNVQRP